MPGILVVQSGSQVVPTLQKDLKYDSYQMPVDTQVANAATPCTGVAANEATYSASSAYAQGLPFNTCTALINSLLTKLLHAAK